MCVCVQMAGNPDQQEDMLDDQYQEEVEDEVWNTDALTHTLYIRNKSVNKLYGSPLYETYIFVFTLLLSHNSFVLFLVS